MSEPSIILTRVQALIEALENSSVSEVELTEGGTRIQIKRAAAITPTVLTPPPMPYPPFPAGMLPGTPPPPTPKNPGYHRRPHPPQHAGFRRRPPRASSRAQDQPPARRRYQRGRRLAAHRSLLQRVFSYL